MFTMFVSLCVATAAITGICEIIRDLIIDMHNTEEFSVHQWFYWYPEKEAGDWYDLYQCPVVFKVPENMLFYRELEGQFELEVDSEDGLVELVFGTQCPDALNKNQVFINTTSSYLAEIDMQFKQESAQYRDMTKAAIY